MKLKKTFSLLAVTAVFAYSSAEAAQCRIVSWKENMVL
ncbi:TPA: conjugal transfer protein, partial [Klebsiella pneumoniae]